MIFNGIDLSPYLRIKEIHGRGISPSELTLIEVPAMDGAYYSQKRRPPRVIEIEADIRASNREELRTKLDQLNAILDVDQPVPIIFPDEPGMIYYGIPESTGEGNEYTFLHQGQLAIICPDPYKYGDEVIVEFPSDVVTVTNEGTTEADPVFELEALEPVTFAMIQNQHNEYMMIGKPVDLEEETPFERDELIFHDDMSTTVGWTDATEIDGTPAGSMESNGVRFEPVSFGSGTGWHGPAMKTSVPEVLTDFRMDAIVGFWNSTANIVGRVEIYLLDEQNRAVCKIAIKDTLNSRSLGWGEARLGDNQVNYYMIDEFGDQPGNWNDFYGMLRFERVGNRWSAYIAKIDQTTGRHHTRRSVIWTDNDEVFTRNVAQVVVHFGQYDSHTTGAMGVYDIKIWKINQGQSYEVPYIAYPEDIITFDHVNKDLLINGESRKDLKDFGATFFTLKKRENQLVVHPSAFNTTLRYRTRFK